MSDERPPSPRTDRAASTSGFSAGAARKRIASNRFDLPDPLTPAMQVNGPKRTSTSTRFLKPFTLSLVSIARSTWKPGPHATSLRDSTALGSGLGRCRREYAGEWANRKDVDRQPFIDLEG